MSTPPFLMLPDSSCIASVVMTLTRVVGYTESPFTLQGQSFRWPGERWSMSLVLPPIVDRAIASDWLAFAASLKGRYGLFTMGDPSAKKPRGVALGTPVVSGGGQVGNTLVTTGWDADTNGVLLKGDYIQVGSGQSSRLHMIVQNANSDSSGSASLFIEPELRYSPTDGSSVVFDNPVGVFRLNSNDFSWSVNPGPVYRFSFDATEAL